MYFVVVVDYLSQQIYNLSQHISTPIFHLHAQQSTASTLVNNSY